MPPELTYHAVDLMTRERLDELPFSSLSYSRALNRPGGWSAQISHRHPKVSGDNRSNLRPNRTGIYVTRGGTPLFGGIYRKSQITVEEGRGLTMTAGGDGILGFFLGDGNRTGRFLKVNKSWDNVDQFTIVKELVDYAQSFPGADLGMEVEFHGPETGGLSGVTRTFDVAGHDRRNIGRLIERIAGLADGFEYDVDVKWDDSDPPLLTPVLSLHYPRRSRRVEQVVLEQGRNIEVIDWTEDGNRQGVETHGIGAGQGDSMLTHTITDADLIWPNGPYARVEATYSHKDLDRDPTLEAATEADHDRFREPPETAKVQVIEGLDAALNVFTTGSEVQMVADDGYLQIASWWRVDGFDVDFDENGRAAMQLELTKTEDL